MDGHGRAPTQLFLENGGATHRLLFANPVKESLYKGILLQVEKLRAWCKVLGATFFKGNEKKHICWTLFSLEREGGPVTCSGMPGPGGHCAK